MSEGSINPSCISYLTSNLNRFHFLLLLLLLHFLFLYVFLLLLLLHLLSPVPMSFDCLLFILVFIDLLHPLCL